MRARRALAEASHHILEAFNRLHLPGASVLPIAGAIVGVYSGLAAGLFANLIALVSGTVFGAARLLAAILPGTGEERTVWKALSEATWRGEYAIVGAPLAIGALLLARMIQPGGPRDEVKRRLRILALLVLGALALYYPLVAVSAVNTVFGHSLDLASSIEQLPIWLKLTAPALGGLLAGTALKRHPETHGHGLPEVVMAVQREGEGLPARGGVRKLIASAITIGTGGSAGREGPIVYGGAAFGSGVGLTLGFSRKNLSILLACGAGAGISASFNAPIAGAVFAMEIILRELELKAFSPIILASVTATMVGRGVMGGAPMLRRLAYEMVSGWEILAYAGLGLVCGVVGWAFVRMLHHAETFFGGRFPGRISPWLGRLPLPARATIGGLLVGVMAILNPAVWGTGHHFVNLAAVRQLGLGFLLAACALKLVATAVTIGSGGSGGTFFPAAVIGAMAGGAFGEVIHQLLPEVTAPSGAYAMVGMGGVVAALTRGPLTGMIMLYELSANYAIILPLMVTTTIASALCHALIERRGPKVTTDAELLAATPVRRLAREAHPVRADTRIRPLVDLLLAAEDGVVTVLDAYGRLYGIVQVEHLREVWREEATHPLVVAADLARKVPTVSAESDTGEALALMDQEDVDALPVVDHEKSAEPYGVITRTAVRRYLFRAQARRHEEGEYPMAPTEVSG
ncbi:MAG TPA: chloride channel protein [Myxococcaceae bacterium]|nr:chloride channel protein [Myxococcaceae bacterium]